MEWRNFQTNTHMDNMDNMDLITETPPFNPYNPFNPVRAEPENTEYAADTYSPEEEIKQFAKELRDKDPGGNYWQFIKSNRPELWGAFLKVDQDIDRAYQEQTTGDILKTIDRARATFNAMLQAHGAHI